MVFFLSSQKFLGSEIEATDVAKELKIRINVRQYSVMAVSGHRKSEDNADSISECNLQPMDDRDR